MYVKLIDQRGPTRLYRAGGETVESGAVTWRDSDPSEATLEDLLARIGSHADVYDRTLISTDPAGYEDGDRDKPFWRLRWARFQQVDADAVRLVICSGPIFVLGDNGKTIDRV
jgi:hypothetical protein